MTTYQEAKDAIFSKFLEIWEGGASVIVGYEPEIFWPDSEPNDNPYLDKYWVKVSKETLDEEQSSFKNSTGVKLYTSKGFIYVELYCPKSDNLADVNGAELAVLVRDGFRGASSGVWFRNSRVKEIEPDNFFRLNVIADYEYDERY